MPEYLKTRQWFAGKPRTVRSIDIVDEIQIPDAASQILLARLEYTEGDQELYVGAEGLLYSAAWNPVFGDSLLGRDRKKAAFSRYSGRAGGYSQPRVPQGLGRQPPDLEASALRAQQSNTAIVFGDRYILKIYRRVEPGIHPEVETDTFLQERGFEHTAALTGTIDYHGADGDSTTIAALHAFVPNQGDVWNYTLHSLSQFFEGALAHHESEQPSLETTRHPFALHRTSDARS